MPRPLRSTRLLYALPMLAGLWVAIALIVAAVMK